MNDVSVILAWASTGQICDAKGKRIENGNVTAGTFKSVELAKVFCDDVLRKRPFLECSIRSPDGLHLETLYSETGWDNSYRIDANGKYRVRLTEWISRADVSENGEYLSVDDQIPLIEFATYRNAKRYCKKIQSRQKLIVPWIFGPDGVIMFCATGDVALDETGEHLIYLPWWKSLWRS